MRNVNEVIIYMNEKYEYENEYEIMQMDAIVRLFLKCLCTGCQSQLLELSKYGFCH